jgi:hypothetical protein
MTTRSCAGRLCAAFSLALASAGCNPGVMIEAPPGGPSGGAGGAGGSAAGGSAPVGCEDAMTLAQGQDLPHNIALDETHVYWTTDGLTTSIERTPKCGGAIETLYEGEDFVDLAGAIAVDGERVYWVGGLGNGDWGVRSIPKTGGEITPLAQGFDEVGGIAIDEDHVYFVSDCVAGTCIQRVSKSGGPVTTIAGEQPVVVDVAVDATHVYWISYPAIGQLWRAPKAGGAAEMLTWMQESPEALVLDDEHVYITTVKDSVTVHIVVVPKTGAPEPTVLTSNVHGAPQGIAVDGTHVYYAVSPALEGKGAVFAVPKAGGEPAALTGIQTSPFALAIDDDAVYFTNNAWQSTVRRAPK